MKIDIKVLVAILVPLSIALITANFTMLGSIQSQVNDNGKTVAAMDAKLTAWVERTKENADDLDEHRKQPHIGMKVAIVE